MANEYYPQFIGESPYEALINQLGLDILEEGDFEEYLRQESGQNPEELSQPELAPIFNEWAKRANYPLKIDMRGGLT